MFAWVGRGDRIEQRYITLGASYGSLTVGCCGAPGVYYRLIVGGGWWNRSDPSSK
jgi:hypothetical protein